MQLNHPQTIPTHQSVEKLFFTKYVFGAQKLGKLWSSRAVPTTLSLSEKQESGASDGLLQSWD